MVAGATVQQGVEKGLKRPREDIMHDHREIQIPLQSKAGLLADGLGPIEPWSVEALNPTVDLAGTEKAKPTMHLDSASSDNAMNTYW